MVLVTNTIFFILCSVFFNNLNKGSHAYSKQMAWFMLLLGTSSVFGAIGHAVHMQLGDSFFKVILFLMNAFIFSSIYFCFRAAYTYINLNRKPSRLYIYLVMAWALIVLVASGIQGNFLVIMIHGLIVLLYSFIVHYIVYRRTKDKATGIVVLGIFISFLPVVVHSLKLSISEWFNHKDIAHVVMIISLVVIYKGARLISESLGVEQSHKPVSA